MKITIKMVMEKQPCREYPLELIREIANGRKSMELSDAFDLDIPPADRIWLVTRFMDDRSNRLFAADCAERAVARISNNPLVGICRRLIERVRDCAEGRITAEELRRHRDLSDADAEAEASYAAYSAYYSAAAYCAAYYAADTADAANAAYCAAYYAAANADATRAYAAECAWQIDRLRFYVDEMEVI